MAASLIILIRASLNAILRTAGTQWPILTTLSPALPPPSPSPRVLVCDRFQYLQNNHIWNEMKIYWSSTQDFFTFGCSECFQMLLNFRNNFGSWRIQRRFHRYNNQERDRIEPLRNIQMDTGYLCDNRYIWQILVFASKSIKINETRISRDIGVLLHMKIVAWTAGVTWVGLSWIGDVVAIYSNCCNTLAMGWVKIKKVDWNRCVLSKWKELLSTVAKSVFASGNRFFEAEFF